jgi:hypothetical protein
MTRFTTNTYYDEFYEYFGGTTILRTRRIADETVRHDWLLFDTVEAAFEFFNDCCSV